MLKATIDKDLKAAMLEGDKRLVSVLRGIKSAILYKEVADQKREEGLNDDEVVQVLKKEQKSRRDAVELYDSAGETERAEEERYQIAVIERYLPEQPSEEMIERLVQQSIEELGLTELNPKDMGKIIGAVKQKNAAIDGGMLSGIVKKIITRQ